MAFLLKKIIGSLLMPLPLIVLACFIAMVFFQLKRVLLAKTILIFGLVSLYLMSIQPIAFALASPLEYAHPKYENQPVEFVIVLGGGHKSDLRQPVTSLLHQISLNRLMEGIRIKQLNPGAKLLLSGYQGTDSISNAEAMAKVAQVFGVSQSDIILNPNARDTSEEAGHWAKRIEDRPAVLVTSALHMKRAMKLFKQHGKELYTGPTGHRTHDKKLSWRSFIPSPSNLDLVTRAWHEYLGIVWLNLRT